MYARLFTICDYHSVCGRPAPCCALELHDMLNTVVRPRLAESLKTHGIRLLSNNNILISRPTDLSLGAIFFIAETHHYEPRFDSDRWRRRRRLPSSKRSGQHQRVLFARVCLRFAILILIWRAGE